nr:uncharacterized protein LOC106691718 [Halyomorpha halys]
MAIQSRSIIKHIDEQNSNESKTKIKTSAVNGTKIKIKTKNSSDSSSVKNNNCNGRVYVKIGEVFGRDKVNPDEKKILSPKKGISKERKSHRSDDEVDLIAEMTESERKQWVEDYLSQLPEFNKIAEPVFSDIKLKEKGAGDADCMTPLYKAPLLNYYKSDFFNSPYIVSNIVNFTHKNHSFNEYQAWKIRRENLKICEKIKHLENRKLSADYYHAKIKNKNYFPNSKAKNRAIENRRIYAENMMLKYMIDKIRRTPNKKAPWYKPENRKYIKT